MNPLRYIVSLGFLLLLFAVHAQGQAPICDGPLCTPNTSASSYTGAAAARVAVRNGRGSSTPFVAAVKLPLPSSNNETVVGSQSFSYVIPIISLPGRAGLDLDLNLYYNSGIWDVDATGGTITFNADRDFPSYGFRLDFGYIEVIPGGNAILAKGDGTKINLASPNGTAYFQSLDGSNIVFGLSGTNVLTYNNGTQVQYQPFPSNSNLLRPVTIKDPNGNFISISYVSGHDQMISTVTDSLGRVITFNYNASSQLISLTQALHPSGTKTLVSFTWTNPYSTNQTWYNFSGLTVNGAPTAGQISVLAECTYPNGTGYRFNYGDWAIINRIDHLSSTAGAGPRNYISYNYPLAGQASLSDVPTYTQETVSPDGGSSNNSAWNYSVTKNAAGAVTSMTVTDPLGNSSITNLDSSSGLMSSVQLKDSDNVLLRTTAYLWASTYIGSTVPGTIITTLNDTGQQSSIQYGYDLLDNVSDIYEYDFGLQLKRHTVNTYLNTAGYTGSAHIVSLPTQTLIEDANGNIVRRTDFGYDETGLTAVSGAAGHADAGFGTGHIIRGNLTSIKRYSNAAAGTGLITRSFTLDTLGNLLTAQMDCCNLKTFNFSSATQYSQPDSIVRGSGIPQFTTSFTYDIDTGLVLTNTDENGQVTQYQYDSVGRTTAVLLPAQSGTVVQLNRSYDDAAANPSVTSYSTNSGNTSVSVTTTDGLGHSLQIDNKNCPNGPQSCSTIISSTKVTYDKLWRQAQVSNPFAPGENPVNTTFAYDGLGRITQVAPPSAGYTQYAYSGNTVTITDPAGKQRKKYTDALGRLVEVDEPGWGDALNGIGSVTISGGEQSYCPRETCLPLQYIYDTGNVQVTVNGSTKTALYGKTSTPSSIASDLANQINNDGSFPVTGNVSGATVTLVARQAGAITNYPLAVSSATNDVPDFGTPSFAVTRSGATLTGGIDGTPEGSSTLYRPIVTAYGYNLSDQLITASVAAMGPVNGVTYAGQQRSYSYDDLGRITSSTTPESGTVTSYYTDVNNNACAGDPSLVCRTVDARSITRTFAYDGINRPLTVSYSDGTPAVTYGYDAGGAGAFALDRLTSITEGANSEIFAYDNLGRIRSVTHNIDQTNYVIQYAYNLMSGIASITYPSGRVVTQNYDSLGRTASISSGSTNYLNSLTYNAAGDALGFTLGNNVQASFTYNDHLQLAKLRYFKSGSPDILNLGYDYTSAGQSNNNGQIQAIHYYTQEQPLTEDRTKSESFTYDSWLRLKAAQTLDVNSTAGSQTWSLAWTYDRLGNRRTQTLVAGDPAFSAYQPSFTFDETKNRINGFSYDAAGNLTGDGAFTYTYDGANRMTQAQQSVSPNTKTTSTYFGALRIKKIVGSTTTRFIYSGSTPIAEYVNGSLSKEYIYARSQLIATVSPTSTTYHHPDHLSNRVETDANGVLVRSFGHLPYGDTWYESSPDPIKFTTYTRDAGTGESGLDYAMFRQYSSSSGRFMSADLLHGNVDAPQSLNRYSYALNDPINTVDPMGLECVKAVRDSAGNITFEVVDCPQHSPNEGGDGNASINPGAGGGGPPGDPCGGQPCGGGASGGNPAFDPKVVKDWLYKNFEKKINDCIKTVFKEDAGKVPQQTRANAPVLDATKNINDLTKMSGGGNRATGFNDPNSGKYGRAYVASEVFKSQEPYAGMAIAGTFVHELGNILDEKLYPPTNGDGKYGSHHGKSDSNWDKDTGAAFEKCVFGTIWTPSGSRDDLP